MNASFAEAAESMYKDQLTGRGVGAHFRGLHSRQQLQSFVKGLPLGLETDEEKSLALRRAIYRSHRRPHIDHRQQQQHRQQRQQRQQQQQLQQQQQQQQ